MIKVTRRARLRKRVGGARRSDPASNVKPEGTVPTLIWKLIQGGGDQSRYR